jgi:hypothetical protein
MSGKGEHRAKKMCTHVCKCKNDMWWNYSRNGGMRGRIKESGGKGEFTYDVFDAL